jgi:signal recognition particle receptor subunit beta
MVLFNYSTKELTAKVVYYGPGLCGKTTNLQWIHEKLPIRNKGKMLSLATETDRTLFFDFLPIDLGTIRGMKTRIQLYTVPGQVFYNATRRMVLKGADCVVFVCDSQEAMIDANLESLENMRQNLEANEINPDDMPLVLQYNKRDLPNALPIEILNEKLNPRGLPFHEAVAIKGQGVEETLKGVTALVFRTLASKYGGAQAAAAAASGAEAKRPGATTAPVPAPPAPPPPAAAPAPVPPPAPALRIVPPPAPRAAEPAPASPLPPLNVSAEEAEDDLLESFELQPSGEIEEILEMELPGGAEDVVESMDLELPPASPPPPPQKPAGKAAAKITLVSGPKETDELRQRISRPLAAPEPELSLDELDADDEEIEELSFDMDTAPNPQVVAPPSPVRADTLPPGTRARSAAPAPKPVAPPAPPPPVAAPPPAASTTAPPASPRPTAIAAVSTPPVNVRIPSTPGETDVSIPIDVKLDGGNQVTIHLRLTLNLRLHT